MSQFSGAPQAPSPNDQLPPVEAPNAGFLLQLFVIPGLIVLTIFVIVGLLRMLAQTPSDPWAYVADLSKTSEARWRAAVNLANLLRDTSKSAVKRDEALAGELARILDAELKDGGREQLRENQITLRVYLCHALGEFQVDRGVDVLIKAATTQRDEAEIDVQRAAVASLAVLAANVKEATGADIAATHPQLMETLLTLSHDKSELVRSSAAYTLGVLGGDAAIKRLEQMLDDEAYPDALYNAATGLARRGNPRVIDVLVEMVDPAQVRGVQVEKQSNAREFKRALIVANGLRAIGQLADANPTADLTRLTVAVERLADSDVDKSIRVEANPVLAKLKRREAPAAVAP